MRLTLLTLLLPLLCFGKVEKAKNALYNDSIPEINFHLHNNKVFFQKVFSSDLSKDEITKQVLMLLNTKKTFKFNQKKQVNDNEFFLTLFQFKADMGRNTPLNASVVIQVKDYKYRVTISEINFRTYARTSKDTVTTDFLLEESLTDKDRIKFRLSRSTEKILVMLNKDFSELFELKNMRILSDF